MTTDRFFALDRREFLTLGVTSAATVMCGFAERAGTPRTSQASYPVALPPLPYPQGALAPSISENTVSFHYGKHHQAYVNNTLKMIVGTDLEKASLGDIIRRTAGKPDQAGLFNNAAQVFNHDFYWSSMKPGGGGEPQGRIADGLRQSFGSYSKFVEAFSGAAATQFGSGWAWLAQDGARLVVVKTSNADNPLTQGLKPLLTIDVWEHAYYLDYQNRRTDYIRAFVEKLLNWDFAGKNLV